MFSFFRTYRRLLLTLLLAGLSGGVAAGESSEIARLQARCRKLIVDQYNLAEAQPVVEQLLSLTLKERGETHQDTVVALHWSGYLATKVGNDPEAQRIWERSLAIQEKLPSKDTLWYSRTLQMLGRVHAHQAHFTWAESALIQALKIRRSAFGLEAQETIELVRDLDWLCKEQVEFICNKSGFPQAEEFLRKKLASREQSFGRDALETLLVRKNLGYLYVHMGDFGKAEQLYQQLLKEYKASGMKCERDLAEVLFALANIYIDIRDLDRAAPLLAESTQIFEKLFGYDHAWTVSCLVQLGALRKHQGDTVRAEAAFRQSIRLAEKLNGPNDIQLYWALCELAEIHLQSNRLSEAEEYLNRILKIVRLKLGQDHFQLIYPLKLMGHVLEVRGDYLKARECYAEARRLANKQTETSLNSAEHCCRALAQMEFLLGHKEAALAAADLIQDLEDKRLDRVLSFTSERQRLDYFSRYGVGSGIGLWATMGEAIPLTRAILRNKGLVLDSIAEDRLLAAATGDPQLLHQRDELIKLRRQLAFLSTSELRIEAEARKPSASRDSDIQTLTRQTESIEAMLAQRISGLGRRRRAMSVRAENIEKALPKRAVLVEFVRYDHYLGQGTDEARYGALIISRYGVPNWIPLGNANAIEKNIKIYQHLVRRGQNDESLLPVLRELFNQLWAPLSEAIPAGVAQIIVCPDAQLNFLSFATLLNSSNRFVGEEYLLSYVSSGRDLLASVNPPPRDPQLLIWANPDFGSTRFEKQLTIPVASTESRRFMRGLRGLDLRSLPGAEKEGLQLNDCAGTIGFTKSTLHLGSDASEAELLRVHSPDVLHLATHGFVLPEDSFANDRITSPATNPMRRSGLALAGARHTLEAWTRGEMVAPENDGVVTAEEIACLNLHGTWLVVLSACDTGLGEVRASEGVMGLRRGFAYAGAQNLLVTLWPIDDERTSTFMPEFYRVALSSGDPPNALALTQRAWLTKLRENEGVAEACRIAGPFILSFQGPPVSTPNVVRAALR